MPSSLLKSFVSKRRIDVNAAANWLPLNFIRGSGGGGGGNGLLTHSQAHKATNQSVR